MMEKITGKIIPTNRISGNIQANNTISGKITRHLQGVKGTIALTHMIGGNVFVHGTIAGTISANRERPVYVGPYEITPSVNDQLLHTNHMSMDDDVSVFAIPYIEVTNPSGGKTATIG